MLPPRLRPLLAVGLILICTSTFAQTNVPLPPTWSDIEEAAITLLEQEEFEEALALIEQTAPKLQGREFEVSDLTMNILFDAGRTEEALTVWEKGLEEGFFYFVIPRSDTFDGVRRTDRFRKLVARNNQMREIAQSESKPKYKVIKPASYSPEASYPLVMIIHGGNQSIVKAMDRWDPTAIGDDAIIAYVQSSRRADTKSYRWDLGGVDIYSVPTAQDEVLGLYQEIVGAYAVDTSQVTLAGFSQGGNLALFMAAEGTIPAKGFIAGSPATRTPLPLETAQAAAERGVRGTIFVGAEDWAAASAETTVSNFEEAGNPVNHIVMEDKGHEFPDNFDEVLREAVKQIYQ
jgi:dienelactone hydrolase